MDQGLVAFSYCVDISHHLLLFQVVADISAGDTFQLQSMMTLHGQGIAS